MEDCIQELSKIIKCRDSLIRQLYLLLSDEPMFQSIFIYGHISCGKSFIVQNLLKYLKYNTSTINCIEHTSNRSLFEKIIIDLTGYELSSSNGYKLDKKCDDFVEFIYRIKSIAEDHSEPLVIVFERCDRLRDMDANILPALLRLGELTRSNVCTIFISDVIWEKYQPKIGMYQPIRIHFSQYTKNEILDIISHMEKPMDYTKDFYESYLTLLLSVFFRFCRDLNELRYMAKKNFDKYTEPIRTKGVSENDRSALCRNILSTLRENLEVIYLRVSANDFEEQSKLSHDIESTTKLALSFELPYYAKYLLIAAYLASYNPAKEDKRIFMKEAGPKRRRTTKRITKTITMRTHEGPRTFPLSRMLAIFCTISESSVDLNATLLTQIPSMCQLGLLSVANECNLDEPKYKCCIDFQFAMVISKNIGFSLRNYLCDYI